MFSIFNTELTNLSRLLHSTILHSHEFKGLKIIQLFPCHKSANSVVNHFHQGQWHNNCFMVQLRLIICLTDLEIKTLEQWYIDVDSCVFFQYPTVIHYAVSLLLWAVGRYTGPYIRLSRATRLLLNMKSWSNFCNKK